MSGTTADPDHPPRGQGRDALVFAAIELISEQGVGGVTYRSVAERAGVAHGLVRHHFTTLAELVRTAVAEWASKSIALTEIEPGTGRVEDFARELPDNVRERAVEHVAMYEIVMTAVRTGYLREQVRETYSGYTEAVTRELARIGVDDPAGDLGRLVFAAVDGLVIQQLVTGEEELIERGLERLRELLRQCR